MGGSISKMMGKIFGSKEMRLLMLGLDAAGKTSTAHQRQSRADLRLTEHFRSDTIQTEARLRRDHDTDCWLQRRDRDVQEREVQCLGCRWTGQDQTVVETLFFGHARLDLRGRQQRS